MEQKKCSACSKLLPVSAFQKRTLSKDGLTASCRKCLKVRDAKRAMLPHRVAARIRYQKTDAGKKAVRRAHVKWITQNRIKRAAHIIIGNAVRDGKLTKKPCEICAATRVHAHHDDYEKPLAVRWLCQKHHLEQHRP